MKNTIQDKSKLVNSVFSDVHKKYDLMNDIMSFGIHRTWKEKFIDWMNPQPETKLIDGASRTGDIAKLFSNKTKNSGQITCVEPNDQMLNQVIDIFKLKIDVSLNLMKKNQKIVGIFTLLVEGINKVITKEQPELTIVQGDTLTSFAG